MPSSSHQTHASSRPGVGQTHLVQASLACLAGVLLLLAFATAAQADQDFVLMGKEGAYLKQNSTVVSGDVGVNQQSAGPFLAGNEELTVGIGTTVQSPTVQVMGDSVKLKDNAQVYDVHYNEISGLGDILGQEFTPLALPLIPAFPPVPTFTPGTQDFDVPQGGTLTLDAGSYGLLKASLDATITLTGGTYDFTEWDMGDNVTIDIEAPTEIRIAGKLAVDQGSTLGPAAGAPTLTANDIVLYVTGINGDTGDLGATPKAAKFGIATTIRAKVFVPNGTLWMRQNGQFTGAFVAKWVILGIGASATFEGGFNLRGVQSGDLTQARAGHSAELLGDGRVLITGGTGAAGVLDSAEVFDPATLTSSALANTLTSPRTEHTSTLLPQSETLLVAGEDTFGLLNTTEMFNPGTEAFRTLSPTVQILRSGHTATALLDGRVLITGGQSSGALGDAEIFDAQSAVLFLPPYDPETATFEILQNGLTTPRWDHTATLLPDGRILITGGAMARACSTRPRSLIRSPKRLRLSRTR